MPFWSTMQVQSFDMGIKILNIKFSNKEHKYRHGQFILYVWKAFSFGININYAWNVEFWAKLNGLDVESKLRRLNIDDGQRLETSIRCRYTDTSMGW